MDNKVRDLLTAFFLIIVGVAVTLLAIVFSVRSAHGPHPNMPMLHAHAAILLASCGAIGGAVGSLSHRARIGVILGIVAAIGITVAVLIFR